MKKSLYFFISMLMVVLVPSCGLDNYDSPDGGIYGNILDQDTNEPIPLPVEGTTGVAINLMEVGTGATQPVGFYAKQDGSFKNTKVFNGDYSVTINGPFEVVGNYLVKINGQTELNIVAKPYSRIKATATANGNVVTVNYSVTATNATAKISQVNAYWDYRKEIDDQTGHYSNKQTDYMGTASGTFTFNLNSEVQYNNNSYKIKSNGNKVYFRISAKVNSYLNYSPVMEIIL